MSVMYQQVYLDDKPVSQPLLADELYPWFHKRVSYSMDHAVRYEGYSVRDLTGPYYVNNLGDVNLHTADGAKLIAYADELNPRYLAGAESIASRLNQFHGYEVKA